MALETGTYISDLVATNPVGSTDTKATLDDHIRFHKLVTLNTWPNITGAVTPTHTALNKVGVTQAQSSSDTSVASTAFVHTAVNAAAMSATTPTVIGDAGKFWGTDGTTPAWTAIPAFSVVLLSTVTASNSATVDVETTFNSTYDAYLIVASGVTIQTDAQTLLGRMKVGGAYDTGNNYRFHLQTSSSAAATYSGTSGSSTASFTVSASMNSQGTTAGSTCDFVMRVYNPASTTHQKAVDYTGVSVNASAEAQMCSGVALNTAVTALTGVRFYAASGNIVAGSFRLYGIKNS